MNKSEHQDERNNISAFVDETAWWPPCILTIAHIPVAGKRIDVFYCAVLIALMEKYDMTQSQIFPSAAMKRLML